MKIAAILFALSACVFVDSKLKGKNQQFALIKPVLFGCHSISRFKFLHAHTAPLLNVDTPMAIKGEYIVVFKQGMQDEDCK